MILTISFDHLIALATCGFNAAHLAVEIGDMDLLANL
jgi:hypothetical protein